MSKVIRTARIDGPVVVLGEAELNLYQEEGKIRAIQSLKMNRSIVMIGDGYTDLEVYLNKASEYFICFTENVSREKVVNKSQYIANSFDEVLTIINNL